MTRHTPGPWKWWTSNSWRRLTSDAPGRLNQEGGVLCPVICRSDNHPDLLVTEADMGLIGAAPDLYKALDDICRYIGDGGQLLPGGPLLVAAEEALKKAETPVQR
jgi:hypothetical protein